MGGGEGTTWAGHWSRTKRRNAGTAGRRMALVALGSYVQVVEDGEVTRLEQIERVDKQACVLGGEGGDVPVRVVGVIVQRGARGVMRVCQVGALRAHEKQVVWFGGAWRRAGDLVPASVHACAGLATLCLDGASTVVVDGVRCRAVDARRLEVRPLRNVTVRLGTRKWRVTHGSLTKSGAGAHGGCGTRGSTLARSTRRQRS